MNKYPTYEDCSECVTNAMYYPLSSNPHYMECPYRWKMWVYEDTGESDECALLSDPFNDAFTGLA